MTYLSEVSSNFVYSYSKLTFCISNINSYCTNSFTHLLTSASSVCVCCHWYLVSSYVASLCMQTIPVFLALIYVVESGERREGATI